MSESHAAEVQAELQQYLNSKNINSLFIAIVENLLIEKPSNPIAFMIEYLAKNYPDQAKVAIDGFSFANAPTTAAVVTSEAKSESKTESKSEPKVKMAIDPKVAEKKTAKYDSSDDEDDDGDDEFVEIPKVPTTPKSPPKSRRASVSSESVDPTKLKAQLSHITSIPKDAAIEKNLLNVVSKSPLLKTLDSDQKDLIVKAFAGPLYISHDDNIITQGEIGDVFYLLEDGLVDVYIKKKPQSNTNHHENGEGQEITEMKVHTYKPGDSFGELAIMYNTPRAATCRAQTDCVLWTLDRVSFKAIIVSANMQKRELFQSFLKQVPILESLTDMEIMTLADSLVEEKYADHKKVCSQGDFGDYFYIIKSGSAVCTQLDATGDDKIVANLKVGDYFGEIALLTTKPRQATVTAHDDLIVLSIDRATFIRVFGSMDEILKRNINNYSKYSDSA